MSDDITTPITVSPEIPEDIIQNTFEGRLLTLLVDVWRTADDTFQVSSRKGVDRHVSPRHLQEHAENSQTPLAVAMLPRIIEARREGDLLSLDDIAEATGRKTFGLEHLLQEICKLHSDRLPYFEILWSVSQGYMPDNLRVGGGAQFVTAAGVRTLDASQWIAEQRQHFLHDQFQMKLDWEVLAPGQLFRELPHSSWQSIAFEHPRNLVVIDSTGDKHEVGIRSAETGMTTPAGRYTDMAEAMRRGGSIVLSAESHADADILDSMDLSAEDWEVEYGQDDLPAAVSEDRRYKISWECGNVCDGSHSVGGHWVLFFHSDGGHSILFGNSEEVATSDMPGNLGDVAMTHRASHP
jgi:hypothetical protein